MVQKPKAMYEMMRVFLESMNYSLIFPDRLKLYQKFVTCIKL